MKNTNKISRYIVRPCPWSSRGFAIVDRLTGDVVAAGFFSRIMAEEYIWREYEKSETE